MWLSDGGHLCLDWYNEGGGEQPTVLMLPGITGAQEDVYNGVQRNIDLMRLNRGKSVGNWLRNELRALNLALTTMQCSITEP